MHYHDLAEWSHDHVFDVGSHAAERGTRLVMWITAAMMLIEIVAGWRFNSMALLADGWHMSSHAVAIGLSACALSVVTYDADLTPVRIRQQLSQHHEIAHATIEIHQRRRGE